MLKNCSKYNMTTYQNYIDGIKLDLRSDEE